MNSIVSSLKDKKTLFTCIAIIVLAVVALALIFSGGERSVEGELILASKRVKLTAEERAGAVSPVKVEAELPEKPTPKKAVKKPVPKKVAKKPAPKKVAKKPVPKKKVAKLAATLPWGINLASFSKASAAKSLVTKLKSSDYNAYTTEFEKDGITWHRVRIGFFKSREEARKVADTLTKKRLVRNKPWVVKPQTDEVIKFTR